jgi:MFS-type transporter involved in bile tolerance (Atg22 family)
VSLVGVVALAGLFENYDLSVLSAAPKQIRESFGLDQSEMTSMLAWVRLGAIPAFLILALAIYFGPGAGIPFFWIPFVFILTGSNVLMRIISSELFPTSSRNTALGWETLCETLGGAIGFALVGSFTAASASIAPAVVAVSALTVFGVIVVWMLPETAGLELEATSQVSSVDAQG